MATSFEPVNGQLKAQFADFELDFSSGELIRDGRRSRLQGQPFQVLSVLLERAGGVVTREELQRRLWPDETFVDFDQGLNKAIAKLREALEDSKTSSKLIETIPRRGYRFTAEVNWVSTRNGQLIAERPPQQRRLPSRNLLAGGVVLALFVTTAVWLNRQTLSVWLGIRPAIQSVAVLPLVNLSNDPAQEYLADGITEQLITDLSYTKPLRVLSRESTLAFKGSNLSITQIAEQLHVDALIEGTVLRANDMARVTVRLTAARPERQLWAASYERNASDLIRLQNQLAADAVNQMRAQLTPQGKTQLNLESKINPEAYDEYMQAQFLLNQQATLKEGKAIPHLERAIQLDPDFAGAYAAMGLAWAMKGVWGGMLPPGNAQEIYATALAYSQKAVKLDPTSSEDYDSLGHSLMQSRRWNEGETAFRHAIELDPNNLGATGHLSVLLTQKGRTDEGVRVSQELLLANPVAIGFRRVHALALFQARRYDEAIIECERLIKLDPNFAPTYMTYAEALVQRGRFQEAEVAYGHSPQGINPGIRALLLVRQGKMAAARRILKDNDSLVTPWSAVSRYLLGEQERGLAELDYLANDVWFIKTYFLRVDPLFDPMRNDPRFTTIVKKTGLLDN